MKIKWSILFELEKSCLSVIEDLRKVSALLTKDGRGGRMGKGRKEGTRQYDHIVIQVNLLS